MKPGAVLRFARRSHDWSLARGAMKSTSCSLRRLASLDAVSSDVANSVESASMTILILDSIEKMTENAVLLGDGGLNSADGGRVLEQNEQSIRRNGRIIDALMHD